MTKFKIKESQLRNVVRSYLMEEADPNWYKKRGKDSVKLVQVVLALKDGISKDDSDAIRSALGVKNKSILADGIWGKKTTALWNKVANNQKVPGSSKEALALVDSDGSLKKSARELLGQEESEEEKAESEEAKKQKQKADREAYEAENLGSFDLDEFNKALGIARYDAYSKVNASGPYKKADNNKKYLKEDGWKFKEGYRTKGKVHKSGTLSGSANMTDPYARGNLRWCFSYSVTRKQSEDPLTIEVRPDGMKSTDFWQGGQSGAVTLINNPRGKTIGDLIGSDEVCFQRDYTSDDGTEYTYNYTGNIIAYLYLRGLAYAVSKAKKRQEEELANQGAEVETFDNES